MSKRLNQLNGVLSNISGWCWARGVPLLRTHTVRGLLQQGEATPHEHEHAHGHGQPQGAEPEPAPSASSSSSLPGPPSRAAAVGHVSRCEVSRQGELLLHVEALEAGLFRVELRLHGG